MFVRNFVRIGAAGALLSAIAWAQPSLTTISDVLFKADGTRFNGLAQFTWVSFESGNGSNIAQQSKTIRIIDGNLFVQLTPTTDAVPAAQYSVKYSSDGKIQFTETWAVPSSTTTLRVRDVRTTQPVFPPGGGGGAGAVTTILESDVTGLVQDLAARAVKGPGYFNSRAAIINDSGGLEGAVGAGTDCVKVNGTAGPCSAGGGGSVVFVDQEVPLGGVDGSNTQFTIVSTPAPTTSLQLFRNGLLQKGGFDYTLTGANITFVSAATPQPGDTLVAYYRH
jgi:hypothetical protein